MSQAKVMVVEDEDSLALGLVDVLAAKGYLVERVARGDTALARIRSEAWDLIVLDVELPGLSGVEVLKALRQEGRQVRVLMLTARGSELDRVVGFEHGADDYVAKPFSLAELLGRIRALLRRSPGFIGQQPEQQSRENVQVGRALVNFAKFQITVDDREVASLPSKAFAVLECLLSRRGQVVSRDELIDSVWGQEECITSRTLNNLIVKIRHAVEANPEQPTTLVTVHGVGYRLETGL